MPRNIGIEEVWKGYHALICVIGFKITMSNKNLKINYILNTAYQILVLIVPLITTPYISRTLGANNIGVYSYTYSIVSYFLLFAVMGTSTYAQRTIAYFQKDIKKRSEKFFEIIVFRCITTFICILIYAGYLISPICKYREVAIFQMIYLIAVAADVSWLFQGMEDFKKIVFKNTLAKVFNIFLIFTLVNSREDVIIYTIVLAGMTFLANISIWPYIPKYIEKVPLKGLKPFSELSEIILLFIPTIAVQVYAVLDKTMIGFFAIDAVENGYYEQTEKIVRMALAIVTSLGTVMIPRIAQLFQNNDQERIKYYLTKSYQFVWFLGVPIMCGLIGITNVFVPVFYGPGYEKIQVLLPIYSLLVVAVALSNVTGCQYLIPTKKQNVYSIAVIASAITNIVLNAVLIPKYLSVGAAIASIVAEYVGALLMLIYVERHKLINIRNIIKLSYKNWMAGIIMLIVVRLFCASFEKNIVTLFLSIIGGGIIYLVVLFLLRDKFFLENSMNTLSKFKHKIINSK